MSYRSQSASSAAKLTIYDDGTVCGISTNNKLHQFTDIREVRWTFRCDWDTSILNFNTGIWLTRCHDVLQNHDIFWLHILPYRNDRTIGRLGVQQNSLRRMVSNTKRYPEYDVTFPRMFQVQRPHRLGVVPLTPPVGTQICHHNLLYM